MRKEGAVKKECVVIKKCAVQQVKEYIVGKECVVRM